MKQLFAKYRFVIVIILILVVAIVVRTANPNYFKSDAKGNALPAFTAANIIYTSNPNFLSGGTLIVYIDKPTARYSSHDNFVNASSDNLFDDEVYQTIKTNKGIVVLIADDASVMTRCWMLLAQKGIKNCFVALDGNEEAFNHQFQPKKQLW